MIELLNCQCVEGFPLFLWRHNSHPGLALDLLVSGFILVGCEDWVIDVMVGGLPGPLCVGWPSHSWGHHYLWQPWHLSGTLS